MQINPYQGNRIANARNGSFPIDAYASGIWRLLGYSLGINANSANTDTPISLLLLPGANFLIDEIWVNGASVSLTTATAGIFTKPAGAGTTIVTSAALSALTGIAVNSELTLAGSVGSTIFNSGQTSGQGTVLDVANTLYFRIGTAQGAAATVDCYIWGVQLP